MRHFIKIAIICLSSLLCVSTNARDIVFCGKKDNDMLRIMEAEGFKPTRYDSVGESIEKAKRGSGVFIAADNYPDQRTDISIKDYAKAKSKNLRIFVEYPNAVPGKDLKEETYHGVFDRVVVTGDYFGEKLPSMSVLTANDCSVIPCDVKNPIMVYAKVAGFDKAEYGLTDTDVYPLVFFSDKNTMVALSCLSNLKTARFGPTASWKTFCESVIDWLTHEDVTLSHWEADPRPMYTRDEALPKDARKIAVKKGTDWLYDAHLFVHPTWKRKALEYQGDGTNPFGPAVPRDALCGDGSDGVLEGHGSYIYKDGSQQYRYWRRCDVQGEVSYLLSSAYDLLGEEKYKDSAEKLLDFIFYESDFRQGTHNDKNSPVYGLLGWGEGQNWVFYSDDNARAILGAMGASALMGNQRWNRQIIENILANFRTCSKQGFHGERLHEGDIINNGWKFYNDRDLVFVNMNFESYCWALYLWLYDKTGYEPLFQKAENAIRITMEAYPNEWRPIQGFQMERARILLPLAWLVRAKDTPEYRGWLDRIVSDILISQDECGAVTETYFNNNTGGINGRTKSNASYGTAEAPLNFSNDDKVSDLLYTCNFLFLGLNEAVHATGDAKYKKALDKLGDFIVRTQVSSEGHPDINGAWFRAFDYGRWDYWAENADAGWGAWCTLSGWIQSWLVGTEAMMEKNTSLWDITGKLDIKSDFEESLWMLD